VPDERYRIRKRKRDKKGKYKQEEFKYDNDGNLYCPLGNVMKHEGTHKRNKKRKDIYTGTNCSNCKIKNNCTNADKRTVAIDVRIKYRKEMWAKLDSPEGKYHYYKRGPTVENIHGDDQKNRGWIQHHLRGYEKAKGEFLLIRIASNLRKIVKYADLKLLKT
jgi:hypothetical protein